MTKAISTHYLIQAPIAYAVSFLGKTLKNEKKYFSFRFDRGWGNPVEVRAGKLGGALNAIRHITLSYIADGNFDQENTFYEIASIFINDRFSISSALTKNSLGEFTLRFKAKGVAPINLASFPLGKGTQLTDFKLIANMIDGLIRWVDACEKCAVANAHLEIDEIEPLLPESVSTYEIPGGRKNIIFSGVEKELTFLTVVVEKDDDKHSTNWKIRSGGSILVVRGDSFATDLIETLGQVASRLIDGDPSVRLPIGRGDDMSYVYCAEYRSDLIGFYRLKINNDYHSLYNSFNVARLVRLEYLVHLADGLKELVAFAKA